MLQYTPYSYGMTTLYIVATPIGNLGDMTYRAVEVLKTVDVILCEDTRVSKKLCDHYAITTPLLSYHAHSAKSRTQEVLGKLKEGNNIALISDAGTPSVSDPGVQLVEMISTELGDVDDIQISPVPGPSALTALVSVAGISGNQFSFLGFMPHKKGKQTLILEMKDAPRPSIFYESPHRIIKTLEMIAELCGTEKQMIVGRELTKIHEEVVRGSVGEVLEHFNTHPDRVRGEFVVMVTS